MKRALGLIVLLLPACIVVENGGAVTVPCCSVNEGARLDTTSVHWDGEFSVSMSDVDGPTACALAENDDMELGFTGSQLFVRFDGPIDFGCPVGIYPLDGERCADDSVRAGCARLRTWDGAGRMVDQAFTVSGAVIVEEVGFQRCSYSVEAVLPGGYVIEGTSVVDELDWFEDNTVCE